MRLWTSMKKVLTKNEKKVLYGLLRYLMLDDWQLQENTMVKHSTIKAIRRRLHQDGYSRSERRLWPSALDATSLMMPHWPAS